MTKSLLRGAVGVVVGTLLLSCADTATAPTSMRVPSPVFDAGGGPRVVISQVYGGGGNASATYQNDFVELFNAGTATQDLSTWSVQYASATGTGAFGGTASQLVALSGSIAPGKYYLVKLASGGATGSALPVTADVTGTINMAGTAGKVALVNQAASLGCNGAGTALCDATQLSHIVDLVGFGTGSSGANFFEGAGAAPTLTNALAAFRKDHGCTDTNNNNTDFLAATPSPRNSGTPANQCAVVVGPLDHVVVSGGSVSSGANITLTAAIQDASNNTIDPSTATFTFTSADENVAKVLSSTGNVATVQGLGTGGSTTITVSATIGALTKTAPATITVVGPLDHIGVSGTNTVASGSTVTLTVSLSDAANQTITDAGATYTFTSADPATVQVQSVAGNIATLKGLVAGGPITVTANATSNGVTKSTTFDVSVTGAPTIVPSTTVVSEIHYDNSGTDVGEAIEIEGDANTSLIGWKLVLYDGNGGKVYSTTPLTQTIPATCGTRGVIVINYPVNGIQNGSPDGWALVNASNQVTEFRSYEGTMTAVDGPAIGLTSTAIDADETVAPGVNRSVQRAGTGVWFGPRASTFGQCNSPVPLGAQGSVTLTSGKVDLALGMQTQFFFSGTDASGQPVNSVVYSTSDTSVIKVDQKGVVSARKVGAAQLIATAPDGATGTTDMSVYLAAGSSGIRLGHNTEFGEPADNDPSDDFLIKRAQYTVSYNPSRGGANWVSWNLDASHIGANGRCPGTCYSADTALINAKITAYTTADWVTGNQYDRGHMAPSADWTSSEADNNTTFFLSNFLPQRHDMNAGPWEKLENALRDSVSVSHGSREAYIIAGGIFTNGVGLGTINGQGKIGIPDSTWKIAVITPAGTGINADGTLPPNSTVLAVNMPNITGIIGEEWPQYITTVAKLERSTGYNFLALLAESTQCRVEGRNCAPTARITSAISAAGWQADEGQTVSFSAGTSSDPDEGDQLAATWTVNGVSAGTSDALSYTFANDGVYQVGLTVTDNSGATSTATMLVTIRNVAPTVNAFAGATILAGEGYAATGSFSDPGADTWAAAVNYGDGSGTAQLPLSGSGFSLAHTYAAAGTYTVVVSVSDGVATTNRTATVVVKSAATAIGELDAMIGALPVNQGQQNSLRVKAAAAAKQLAAGNTTPTVNTLGALQEEVRAMLQSGRVSAEQGAALIAYVDRIIASIQR